MLNCNILAAIWGLLRMLCNLRRTIREKPGAYSQSVAVRKKTKNSKQTQKNKTKNNNNVNKCNYNEHSNQELLQNQTTPCLIPGIDTTCSDVALHRGERVSVAWCDRV